MKRKKVNFNPDDQTSLIDACRQSDKLAQRLLVEQYYGYVKSIVLRYNSVKENVEEVINDSFLKVFLNLQNFNSQLSFKAWLRTITVNTAIDYYRKQSHQPIHLDSEGLPLSDVSPDILSSMSAEYILSMVDKLPPSYRMVFMLHVVEGYPHKDIAEKLGISEGTSKSNLRDARRKLQSLLLTK